MAEVVWVRRISAYGLCLDADGGVLVARAADGRRWRLPGAVVGHGVDPRDTVVRAFNEQTGLAVEVTGVRDVVTDVDAGPDGAAARQDDQVVFEVEVVVAGGGVAERSTWATPSDLDHLPLTPRTARLLGRLDSLTGTDWWAEEAITAGATVTGRQVLQRFAAYALATDPKGNVLLTLIAAGYPRAGHWHLPGGGTDLGEGAQEGLLRELVEETGQRGQVQSLLAIGHHHDPQALGPEEIPMDFHGVRAVYRVRVDRPTAARVLESSGSTARADWFAPHEAMTLPLTNAARDALVRALAAR